MKTKQVLKVILIFVFLTLLFSGCKNSEPNAEPLVDDLKTEQEQTVSPVEANIIYQLSSYADKRELTHFETGAYYGTRPTESSPQGHVLYLDFETKKVSVVGDAELEKVLDTHFFTDQNYLYYVRFDGHNIVLYRASLEGEDAVALSYPTILYDTKFIVSDENGCLYMEFSNGNSYNELVKFDFNNMNQEVVFSNYGSKFHITGVKDGKILISQPKNENFFIAQENEESLFCYEYDIAKDITKTIGFLPYDEIVGHKKTHPSENFIDNYTNTQYIVSHIADDFFEGVIITANNMDTGETYEIEMEFTGTRFYYILPVAATEDFFIVIANYLEIDFFSNQPLLGYITKQDYNNGIYNVTLFDYGDIPTTLFS